MPGGISYWEYNDRVLCNVMPMDVCHVLLGRPCQFNRKLAYDGRGNTSTFEKDGRRHTLHPLKDEKPKEKKLMLVGGK